MFKINTIGKLLDAVHEEMDSILKNKFYKYIVRISQVNGFSLFLYVKEGEKF